ncbi:MAG: hypothetical protein JWP09_504 [Candidatus Taylorbacteria bacterium]|nr:hypothetical protein [Candidatus Taylorbacteria bacterium]
MLFPFLKSKKENKTYAIFCIDSASVTLTVLEKTIDDQEHISHISRYSLEINNMKDTDKMIREVKETLQKIFDGFKKHKLFDLIKPDTEIVILVGSPWHIGWGNVVKVEKEKAFKVTQKLIDESIKSSFESVHPDLSITNVNIMGQRLNGYAMKSAISKITKSLELKVYVSSAPKVFVNVVEVNIKSVFPHHVMTFYSYNIAIFDSILNTTNKSDCLIVIPEIETTSLVLIKNSIIESEASVPFGAAVLARTLFGAKSSSVQESLLKTKRFVEGTLDVPELEAIGGQIKIVKDNFLGQFRDIVWKMSDTLVLPGDIFVVGRNLATHFVFEWINSDEYIKNTFTVDDFKVSNLRGNDLISEKKLNGMFHHKSVPLSVAISTQFIVKK